MQVSLPLSRVSSHTLLLILIRSIKNWPPHPPATIPQHMIFISSTLTHSLIYPTSVPQLPSPPSDIAFIRPSPTHYCYPGRTETCILELVPFFSCTTYLSKSAAISKPSSLAASHSDTIWNSGPLRTNRRVGAWRTKGLAPYSKRGRTPDLISS